jgi:GNAT superfamily N-acetyltransferase
MEDNDKIIAFYIFSLHGQKLQALFVDPSYIGKGVGRLLWKDLLQKAKRLNIEAFTIDSDPYAEAFYVKMGAKRIGEIQSTVFPNRYIPLMSATVN